MKSQHILQRKWPIAYMLYIHQNRGNWIWARSWFLCLKNTAITNVKGCITTSLHYSDVMTSAMASQITSVSIVSLNVYSREDQIKHQILRHWLCEGNPAVIGGFPSQSVSNAENVFIWWRHHVSAVAESIKHCCTNEPKIMKALLTLKSQCTRLKSFESMRHKRDQKL